MISCKKNGVLSQVPFASTLPKWKHTNSIQYIDELLPVYLGHLNDIDGSYYAWSFDNITMLDDDTIVILFGCRPAHYATYGNKTYMCKYTISTGERVVEEMEFDDVAQSLIKVDDVYYVFTGANRYSTTDFETWESESITTPYSPMYGIDFNGRFIALPNTSSKSRILYSDDLGLTWNAIDTGNNMYITHGGIANVDGTCVIYCTSTSPTDVTHIGDANTGDRYVLTSTDGLTWNEPVKCSGDLGYGGPSYVSGTFENIGDDWYYFTSNRQQIPPVSGKMNLFKGSADDVINGTMSLYMCVDEIKVDENYINGSGVYMTDNGNVGMCTDGETLYFTYNRPLGHSINEWCSNSMQVLSMLSRFKRTTEDDYFDSDWETKRDSFVNAKSHNHTYYAYENDTNITQANMKFGQATTEYNGGSTTKFKNGTFEFDQDLEFAFTNGFKLEIAFNRFTSPSSPNKIGTNISGNTYSTYVSSTSGVFIPSVVQSNTMGTAACSIHTRTKETPDYLVMEYKNGVLSAYCNGFTFEEIKNTKNADDYPWSTSNCVFIESVWDYLNSRSPVTHCEIKALTVDVW